MHKQGRYNRHSAPKYFLAKKRTVRNVGYKKISYLRRSIVFLREMFFNHTQRAKHYIPLIAKRFEEQLKEYIQSNPEPTDTLDKLSELILFNKTKNPKIEISELDKTLNTQLNNLALSNWANSDKPWENEALSKKLKLIIIEELSWLKINSKENTQHCENTRDDARFQEYMKKHWNGYWMTDVPKFFLSVKIKPTEILLKGDHNFLSYFGEYKFLALCQLIELANVENLYIPGCDMFRWSTPRLHALCNTLKEGSLKRLNLESNYLDNDTFGLEKWNLLCDAIQLSKLEELDLSWNFVVTGFKNEHWEKLSHALRYSLVLKLNLGGNATCNFTPTQWQQFADLLEHSQLISLNLWRNDYGYGKMPRNSWQLLLNALAKSHLTELNLDNCGMQHTPLTLWTCFGDMLEESPIQSLSLDRNYLNKLKNNGGWEAFCNALSRSHLKILNLKNNDFDQLSPVEWQIFGMMLKKTNITELNLVENNLQRLDDEQWIAFKEGIENTNVTTLILNIGGSDDDRWRNTLSQKKNQELQDILQRNAMMQMELDQSGKREGWSNN